MSREFGIYPKGREPQLWNGCRACIDKEGHFYIPYNKISRECRYESGWEDFEWWINTVAIPRVEVGVRAGRTKFGFSSESNFYTCEVDNKDNGHCIDIGFYSTECFDEIVKEM